MKKYKTLAISAALSLSILAGCSTADVTASSEDIVTANNTVVVTSDETLTTTTSIESVAVATAVEANATSHDATTDYEYNEDDVVEIALGTSITEDSGAVDVDGTTVTISAAGTYRISGSLSDGQVIVDAGGEAVVQLILDNAEITNADGAAIAVMSAETAIVILADGSVNTLADGATYAFAEGEDEPNATLYSTSDLTITGEGALYVQASYNDGIASKDGLVIDSGDITIEAVDDGIRGKDYVVINDGTLDITSGGDGIKADNDEDETLGYISVTGGSVTVTADGDAIQAATDVLVTGGDFDIATGGGSSAGLAADESAKGLKGAVSVVIEGGSFSINTADDAIHSDVAIVIEDGTFEIATGDDAIHADDTVEINGGTIHVTESYEGIEGAVITINAGDIDITASDDGLNVAGGVDGSGTATATEGAGADTFRDGPGGGGGAPAEEVPGEYYIYINGGTVVIDADGDGIDSNGYVSMTGGTVVINGPNSGRDSAMDHNGTFDMSGGTLIGTNTDGQMSEGIDAGTQASLYVTTQTEVAAGTMIHIETSDGDDVVTFEATKSFSVIVFSSPDLVAGDTYSLYFDGTASGDDVGGLYAADAYNDDGTLAGTATAS